MAKTSRDVATRALRLIGARGINETIAGEDYLYALEAMTNALAELQDQHSIPATWTVETVPDDVFLAFSSMTAAAISSAYGLQGPRRTAAIGRIRAALLPDDRTDRRDTDEDGTITDAETQAGKRAAYY